MQDAGTLRNLIGQKERELQEMNELRIKALEKAIIDRDRHLEEGRNKFMQLKEDFQVNSVFHTLPHSPDPNGF
jgi:hypothetical protein